MKSKSNIYANHHWNKPKFIIEIKTQQNESFVEAEGISFIKNKGFYSVILKNCVFLKNISLKKNDEIYPQIVDISGNTLYVFNEFNIEKGEYSTVTLDIYFPTFHTIFYYELLQSWIMKESRFHWRNLTQLRKYVWLDACCAWMKNLPHGQKYFWKPSGHWYTQPYYYISQNSPTLCCDFTNIQTTNDLYCYLGELLLGEKGYVGRNLDSLIDILNYVENTKNYNLEIKGISYLKKNLIIKYYSADEYVADLCEILERYFLIQYIE